MLDSNFSLEVTPVICWICVPLDYLLVLWKYVRYLSAMYFHLSR